MSSAPPRYRVLQHIGKGGMGEVFLAEDPVLERKVAIKFLPEMLQQDPRARERFQREAKSAAALDHPFICKIYEISEVEGRPCIVMEYVPGETLQARLTRQALPLRQALQVAEEIAEALEEAHKRRIVHRDLKPSNVMLSAQGHVKVMDFGLAKQVPEAAPGPQDETVGDGLTRLGVRVGTPGYMSPEQVLGGKVDGRSDIFSFGIVLYEALTGMHPFQRSSLGETVAAILREPPAPVDRHVKEIPDAVNLTFGKLLAKEPADRFQGFDAVRAEVRRLLADLTGPAAVSLPQPVTPPAPTGGERQPCVGRETEQVELRRLLDQAVGGRGALVLIGGESGVGKTRLVEDLLLEARQRGCLTLTGRCYETEGTPPFIPFVELLEQASQLMPRPGLREALGDAAPEVAKLLPELRRLVPDIPAPLELPPEQQRRYLFNCVRDFLDRSSRLRPLAVLLDDLHWGEESTLLLLHHVAQQLSQIPMLVLGTYRDVELEGEHPFAKTLEALTRQRLAQRVPLKCLTKDGVRAMLAALGGQPPPDALVQAVFGETEGNPFFVEEVYQHLAEEGKLFDVEGRWRPDLRMDELDVPEGIRLVVARRLQRLSDGTRRLLTAAAVVGRSFGLDLLEAVDEATGDELLTALEEAERSQLIAATTGGREAQWRFPHELIRQTLMSNLSVLRRQRLHLRVAEAIERVYAKSLEKRVSDLAHHFYQAGTAAEAAKTTRYLKLAGDEARALYANDEAVRHYQRALETLGEADSGDRERIALTERLADLLGPMGRREAALAQYETLRRGCETTGDRPGQARAYRKMGGLHWDAGDRERALTCCQAGLALLDRHAEHIELAHLYQEMGRLAFRNGDNRRALEWGEMALAQAEGLAAGSTGSDMAKDPGGETEAVAAMSQAHNTLGVALARMGRLDEAVTHVERSVAVAEQHALLHAACRGYTNLGVLYSMLDPSRAIETCTRGLAMAKRIGDLGFQSRIYANLAAAYCALTDQCLEEGTVAAQAAIDLDRQLGQLDHLAVPLIVLGQIHQCHGQPELALKCYTEALGLAEGTGEPQLLFPCYDGLATLHLDMGDRTKAQAYMQKAQQVCEEAGLHPDSLMVLPFLC